MKISKFYARGTYCRKDDCTQLCAICDNASYLLDLGKVAEARRWTTQLLLENSNEVDRNAFLSLKEIHDGIFEWVKNGKSLFLFSEISGNGKTSWANKLFMQFVFEYARLMSLKRKAELPEPVVAWVNVPEMFEKFKLEMSTGEVDKTFRNNLMKARLLVLDDLGAEKSSEWAIGQLYLYINARLEAQLSTIITSNLSVDQLFESHYINKRTQSRLHSYREIELFGPDRRGFKS